MKGNRGTRRSFIRTGLLVAGGMGLGLAALRGLRPGGVPPSVHAGLGPLRPVRDETTGLPLLMLPEGYRYHTFAWAGQIMGDGFAFPKRHDGMGVVGDHQQRITLICNHELRGSSGAFGNPETAWDVTGGGTTTFVFDTSAERLVDSYVSLNGTLNNCAGGVTPWGTWLSCEEAVYSPELAHHGIENRQRFWDIGRAKRPHGYVFEVPTEGVREPQPILEMGQFWHEAAAVDPETGIVYMTEDRGSVAGFYRFIPDTPRQLAGGGRLQMLSVHDFPDLTTGVKPFSPMPISWVDIAEPGRGNSPGTHDGQGVVQQGLQAGGSEFCGLEGCAINDGRVYFTSKNGGAAGAGYIFCLDLGNATLQLVYEARGGGAFSGPDNIIFSPRGSLVVCEDRERGDAFGQYIAGLNADGELFAFCRVNPYISGRYHGHDLARSAAISEWAGVCFSPDGQWMFANIYNPGLSCAITGPWTPGLI